MGARVGSQGVLQLTGIWVKSSLDVVVGMSHGYGTSEPL